MTQGARTEALEQPSRWERVEGGRADFILGGSKITADGDRSHEIMFLMLPAASPFPVHSPRHP